MIFANLKLSKLLLLFKNHKKSLNSLGFYRLGRVIGNKDLSFLGLTQAVAGLLGRVAPSTGAVAGIEIRVDPPLWPQSLNRPSLGPVKQS